MADNNVETSKKSGFSFRMKRSNSKSRKDEQKPVDSEPNEVGNKPEMEKTAEHSEATTTPVKATMNKSVDYETDEAGGFTSCGEDVSPKSVKSDESPEAEGRIKKKAKRRSRSLFRRNAKNKDGKNSEKTDEASDKNAATEKEPNETAKESHSCMTDEKQVVCEEAEHDLTAQSDVEYGGEASETDGEFAGEEEFDEIALQSGNETADETKGEFKKDEQRSGTKKKGFFKRGLSLRRSKSKKKRRHSESHDEKPATKEADTADTEKPTILKPKSSSFATQTENPEVNNEKKSDESANGAEAPSVPEESQDNKKPPPKPLRKVSFAEPQYIDSEGDSPTEEVVETGNDAKDATSVPDEATTETPVTNSDVVTKKDGPDDVFGPAVTDQTTKSNDDAPKVDEVPTTTTEADDDELTEVSSVTSSLVASSDITPQVCTDESEPFVIADAEDTGSRITLVESGEIGEGSGFKPDAKEESQAESEKLLEKDETAKLMKEVDWTVLQQSCDMSGELSRVRKHTLFSVKRLCCSVM